MRVRSLFLIMALAIAASAQNIRTSVRIEHPKFGDDPYVYVPFDVPAGVNAITFHFGYDRTNARFDIGVFDQRFSGLGPDKRGFRGWSGAIRDDFFIGATDASNGYQKGPIAAGKWYLIIGRAKVPDDGADLSIEIDFNAIGDAARKRLEFERSKTFDLSKDTFAPFPRAKTGELTWFKGDLHVHTFHGDGSWSVEGALRSAEANGIDFVALTEHNTYSHHAELDALAAKFPGLLLIRGEEVTTYGGHINVWGLPPGRWVDFRLMPGMENSGLAIALETAKFGGLASINHPTMNCYGCTWTYDKSWETLDSVEIWNATWDKDDEAALKIWDGFLQNGRMITAVGSSDSHQPPYEASPYPTNLRIGDPSVFIGSKTKTMRALFAAVRAGRVFIAENPRHSLKFTAGAATIGARLPVKPVDLSIEASGFPADARLVLISDGQKIAAADIGEKGTMRSAFAPAKPTYVRLEVRSKDGKMLAMTNPIYFR